MYKSFLTLLLITGIIIAFTSISDAVEVKKIYDHYCAQCHGSGGDGKGPNATYLPVAPRKHNDPEGMGKLSDKQLFTAIKDGGIGISKSSAMPVWSKTLSDEEINALVKYMRMLCKCSGPS